MSLKPREDFVMVERVESPTSSKGGILLPEIAKQQTNKGKVILIGPGIIKDGQRLPVEGIKPGQIAYFSNYAGNEIESNDKKFLFLRQTEVLAVED